MKKSFEVCEWKEISFTKVLNFGRDNVKCYGYSVSRNEKKFIITFDDDEPNNDWNDSKHAVLRDEDGKYIRRLNDDDYVFIDTNSLYVNL